MTDPPFCACGCGQPANCYRGVFRKYAKGHDFFAWREKRWLEDHDGKFPACGGCGAPVGFRRGVPKKYCGPQCSSKIVGAFKRPEVQAKITATFQDRYGVNRASMLPEAREALSKAKVGVKRLVPVSEESRKRHSEAAKRMWAKPGYREKMRPKLSAAMKRRWREGTVHVRPEFQMSLLHGRIRSKLKLGSLGFWSEVRVDTYQVDELNYPKKVIVEIYGNRTHANPKIHSPSDTIWFFGSPPKAASEIWKYDAERQAKLEALGYKVIVVWESDNLLEKYQEIVEALQERG